MQQLYNITFYFINCDLISCHFIIIQSIDKLKAWRLALKGKVCCNACYIALTVVICLLKWANNSQPIPKQVYTLNKLTSFKINTDGANKVWWSSTGKICIEAYITTVCSLKEQKVEELLNCVLVYKEGGGNLFPNKRNFITFNQIHGLINGRFVRRDKDVCVLMVFNSCEVAAVKCCPHAEQSINYWDPRLKIAPQASVHASSACTQSISWAGPPACCAPPCSHTGRLAALPLRMAQSSEASHMRAEIVLTHHPLGWQLQGAAVGHTQQCKCSL